MRERLVFEAARSMLLTPRLLGLGACGAILLALASHGQAATVSSAGAGSPRVDQGAKSVPSVPVDSDASDVSSEGKSDIGFRQWINDFRPYALANGINAETFDNVFRTAQLQSSILRLTTTQPEFTRPVWQYLDTAVSSARTMRGRQLMSLYDDQLRRAEARYGIPGSIVIAIWGMESNYGANFGNYPTIDALATLAYGGHRENWARSELIAALKIIQEGDIDHARMRGSWAGAMGNTQFMPSSFLAYAVDGDGDGKRDIWNSIPDVIASTANFLQRSGWRGGQTWGVEVRLPDNFSYAQADGTQQHSIEQWQQMGVRPLDGGSLPQVDEAAILLPAGAHGPAFLVGHNFRTILRYNNSTSYALGVSLLAQRVSGGNGVQGVWPRSEQPVSRAQKTQLQMWLNDLGYNAGSADGIVGSGTQRALRMFQNDHGLPADGFVTQEVLQRIGSIHDNQ